MTKYSFPTYKHLRELDNITLIHGTEDEVVPYEQAQKLAKENKNIHLITIEKGKHNNLSEFSLFREALDRLLN
jgi:uncharacterized protein